MRADYRTVQAQVWRSMRATQEVVDAAGIEPELQEMLRLRASQINGCAYCVDLHSKAMRAHGADEDKIHLVSAWREAACFTRRERAALAWCDAVTKLYENGVPDQLYEELAAEFTTDEVVALNWIVAAINAWNRIAVPLGKKGGKPVEED